MANLILYSGTQSLTAGAAKFGTAGRASGVFKNSPSSFFSSTNTDGGNFTGPGRIECWVRQATNPGTVKVMFGYAEWFWVGIDTSGNLTAHFGPSATESTLTTSFFVCDDVYHHIAFVVNGTTVSLYADSNRVATGTFTQTCGTADGLGTKIGGFEIPGYDWPGYIDEVAYFNDAVGYIGATYTVPSSAYVGNESGILALYHFDNNLNDSASGTTIDPSNAAIVYSPANWYVTSGLAKTINPGAYLSLVVDGSPSAVNFNFDLTGIASPVPQVSWYVDEELYGTAEIAANVTATLPGTTTATKRVIRLVVKSMTETQDRWSPQATAVKLTSITLTGGSGGVASHDSSPTSVWVYGDSITEAVRALGSTQTNDTDRNDAVQGWAYQLRNRLGVEVGVIGFGGSGLTVTGSGGVPVLGTSYNQLWSGQSRSFSTPPDIIVLNEGTNDGGDITSAYTSVLNGLIAATPDSTIIVAMRPFNGSHASQIQSAVAACSKPSRVYYLDTTGWFNSGESTDGLHPYGYENLRTISYRAAAGIREALARRRGPLFRLSAGSIWESLTPQSL